MRSAVKTVLVSPMFAWADTTVYKTRISSIAPSRSGVAGIVAGYLGLNRGDKRIPELLSSFSMITRTYAVGGEISIGRDYATVVMPRRLLGNHRCRKDIILDVKSHRETGVFPKEFIQNVAYEVILVDDGQIDEIVGLDISKKTHPEFAIFAGRKAYPFSVPVRWERGCLEDLMLSNNIPSELGARLIETRWENDILDLKETKKDVRLDNVNNFIERSREKRIESVLIAPKKGDI